MKKEGDTLVPLERLLREAYHIETAKELYKIFDVKEAINFVCDKLEKLNIKDVGLNLSNILSLDALCLNQDRHTNNISFIIDKNNNIKFSPIYDNGDSFLSDLYTFPDNKPVEDLLRRISSKPFSASFDKQLNAVNDICPNTFVTNFSGYDLYNFCNEAKQYYSKDIVERIKDIATIQLEKYRDVLVRNFKRESSAIL